MDKQQGLQSSEDNTHNIHTTVSDSHQDNKKKVKYFS